MSKHKTYIQNLYANGYNKEQIAKTLGIDISEVEETMKTWKL